MAASPRQNLQVLENQCRRQVFNVIFELEQTAQREVQQANDLCLALIRTQPSVYRPSLIQAKNEAILHLWLQAKRKSIDVLFMYIGLKQEIQDLGIEEALSSPLFEQFRPVFFHADLQVTEVLPPAVTLDRCSRFYQLFTEAQSLEAAAKRLFGNNDSMDIFSLLEACRKLTEIPLESAYILQTKWGICLQTQEILLSQVYLVKARVQQALKDAPMQDELRNYQAICHNRATHYRQTGRKQAAGFWFHKVMKIGKAINESDNEVKIAYGEALRLAKAYDKATPLFSALLQELEAEDLEDGELWSARKRVVALQQVVVGARDRRNPLNTAELIARILARKAEKELEDGELCNARKRVAALQQLAWAARDRFNPLAAVESLDRILKLRTEKVDIKCVRIELSSILTQMCRFKEAEAVLTPLLETSEQPDISLCRALGHLYLAWEKFPESERWLQLGLSQRPNNPYYLLLTYARLCLKLERLDEAQSYLARCLRLKVQQPRDKAYVFDLICSYCLHREDFLQLASWHLRSVNWKNGWGITVSDMALSLFLSGMMNLDMGRSMEGIENLKIVLQFRHSTDQQLMIVCKLAEAYMELGEVEEAENLLRTAEKQTEMMREMTPAAAFFAIQGRLCLAKQELNQASDLLHRALVIQERVIPNTKETARTYIALGHLELTAERYEEAFKRFSQALEILGVSISAADAYSGLASMYAKTGDWESARTLLARGLEALRLLPQHPLTIKLQSQLQYLEQQ